MRLSPSLIWHAPRRISSSMLLKRADSATFCAVLVAIAYAGFILLRLHTFGDPSAFIVAGDRFVNAAQAPHGLIILPHGSGYDGQFYYRLALNPFNNHVTAYGITFDKPAYRQQRILYPLIAWLLSFGQAQLVPVTLIVVNYVALIVLGFVAGRYAQAFGRSALWGLAIPLYPGFVLSVARDLAEPLAAVLLITSLLLAQRRRFVAAAIALSLAILTRETMLLVALALGLVWAAGWLYHWLRVLAPNLSPNLAARLAPDLAPALPRIPWYYAFTPLAVFACWQSLLLIEWGHLAYTNGAGNIGVPFEGFARLLGVVAAGASLEQRGIYWEQLVIIVFAVLVSLSLRMTQTPFFTRLAWIFAAALSVCLTTLVWVDDWAFLRALAEFFLLGDCILIAGR
ncbi:MAG: hypothetical protein ABI068_17110, partial [Ktedonobacterales bacterium]